MQGLRQEDRPLREVAARTLPHGQGPHVRRGASGVGGWGARANDARIAVTHHLARGVYRSGDSDHGQTPHIA